MEDKSRSSASLNLNIVCHWGWDGLGIYQSKRNESTLKMETSKLFSQYNTWTLWLKSKIRTIQTIICEKPQESEHQMITLTFCISGKPPEIQQVMSMTSVFRLGRQDGWISLHFSVRRTNGHSDRVLQNYQWMTNGCVFSVTGEYRTTIMWRSCLSELNEK